MRTWLRLAVIASCLALTAAAQAQVSLAGSDWTGAARLKGKVSVPGEGSDKLNGPATYSLYFGPLAAQGLAANQFRAVMDDGVETLDFVGTYGSDARGNPILTPDPQAFAQALRELIDDVCMAQFADPAQCAIFDTLSLSVSNARFKNKLRTSKAGAQSIKSSGQVDFAFLQGSSVVVRVKLRIKSGAGGLL